MYAKILGAFVVVGLVGAGMGYATFAFFSDTETATANIFTAGDLDLRTDGVNSISGKIDEGNLAPGDSVGDSILLTNVGSIFTGNARGHEVRLDMKFEVDTTDDLGNVDDPDDGGPSAIPFAQFLEVTTLTYGSTNLLAGVADSTGNGWIDLDDLEAHGAFTGLDDPLAAGADLTIEVFFRTEGGNDLKRDSVQVDITFFLRQAGETPLA